MANRPTHVLLERLAISLCLNDTPEAIECKKQFDYLIETDMSVDDIVIDLMNLLLSGDKKINGNYDISLIQMLYHRYTLFEPLLSGFVEDFALITLLKLYYMQDTYLNGECFKTPPKLLAVSDNEIAKYLTVKYFDLMDITPEIYQLKLDSLYELIANELTKLKDTNLVFLGFGGVNYNILHTLHKAAKKYKVKLPSITVIESDEIDITNIFRLPITRRYFNPSKITIAKKYGFQTVEKYIKDINELKEFDNAIFVGNVDLSLRSKLFAQNEFGYVFIGHRDKSYTVYNNYYINRSEDIDISSFIVETYGRIRPASFMLSMQYMTFYTLKAIQHTIERNPYKFTFNENALSKLHPQLFPYDIKKHAAFVGDVYRMILKENCIRRFIPRITPMAETINKLRAKKNVSSYLTTRSNPESALSIRLTKIISEIFERHIKSLVDSGFRLESEELDKRHLLIVNVGEKFAVTKNLEIDNKWQIGDIVQHIKLRIRRNIDDIYSYLKNVLEDDNIYGVIARTHDNLHINITHPICILSIDNFEFVEFIEYVLKTNVIQIDQDMRPYTVLKKYIQPDKVSPIDSCLMIKYSQDYYKQSYLGPYIVRNEKVFKFKGFACVPTHIAVYKNYIIPEYSMILFTPDLKEQIVAGHNPNTKRSISQYIQRVSGLCWGSAKPNTTPIVFSIANFNSAYTQYTNAAYYKTMKKLALYLLEEKQKRG